MNVTHEFFPIIGHNLTLFTLDMREETSDRLSADLSSIEELLYAVENKVNESSFELFDGENSGRRTAGNTVGLSAHDRASLYTDMQL